MWADSFSVPVSTEQHVPAWDTQVENPDTGVVSVEQAVLDVATSDPVTGAPVWLDATVVCAHSSDPALLLTRACPQRRSRCQ